MSLILKQFVNYSKLYNNNITHIFDNHPYIFTHVMYKKKKRKVEKVVKTEEQKQISSSNVIRRQDLIGNPQTSDSISKSIKHQLKLVSIGFVTRKHIARFRKYKDLRDIYKTHDKSFNISDSFVTPLTILQHESNLPKTISNSRHNFPHSIHYKVDWYGASTPGPHASDNSFYVSFNWKDLNLSPVQIDGLKEILGPNRYDSESSICVLESNIFDNLNQNASYLGKNTFSYIKIKFFLSIY
ncbi:hypothetical protein MACK_003990 [Theileria orientalis]|uniref:Small ribosomal subunit protein mS35 mitochondrial conserved domain-containing protein n=1 Tax=Theileria orientalis TaxID=68886 RepID=A0A976SJS7_THEOR|nr:hypothetical protein MACK_003990 [Theileria orientalis]